MHVNFINWTVEITRLTKIKWEIEIIERIRLIEIGATPSTRYRDAIGASIFPDPSINFLTPREGKGLRPNLMTT